MNMQIHCLISCFFIRMSSSIWLMHAVSGKKRITCASALQSSLKREKIILAEILDFANNLRHYTRNYWRRSREMKRNQKSKQCRDAGTYLLPFQFLPYIAVCLYMSTMQKQSTTLHFVRLPHVGRKHTSAKIHIVSTMSNNTEWLLSGVEQKLQKNRRRRRISMLHTLNIEMKNEEKKHNETNRTIWAAKRNQEVQDGKKVVGVDEVLPFCQTETNINRHIGECGVTEDEDSTFRCVWVCSRLMTLSSSSSSSFLFAFQRRRETLMNRIFHTQTHTPHRIVSIVFFFFLFFFLLFTAQCSPSIVFVWWSRFEGTKAWVFKCVEFPLKKHLRAQTQTRAM